MKETVADAAREFADIFGDAPEFYGIAPGRVEVLGNHTDYNDGFALAAAINRTVVVVGRPIDGPMSKAYSLTFKSGAAFETGNPAVNPSEHWLNYLMSVVWQFSRLGKRPGSFEALITGDVPLGAGLSSSAAMELASAHFLKAMEGFEMSALDMATNCRKAENGFVGVGCGILDQMSSALGQNGRLLLLDCRSVRVTDYVPLPRNLSLVIADTNAARSLAAGDYNNRQESCFRAAKACAERHPEKKITHLRDIGAELLDACRDAMSDTDFRRARHVVNENARVLAGAAALKKGDARAMGRLMNESHESSRRDFENSGTELDAMVATAAGLPGWYGSRLSGGGFGGATVNLVETDQADAFGRTLAERYRAATGMEANVYAFSASEGASGGRL